jgi:membrane-bound lytic murein transglycosylase F
VTALAQRTGRISPYDDLAMEYAGQYGFDWRLIVSQMYQESRFDPEARSFADAGGLLQVLPSTAVELGFDGADITDPEIGLHAGVRYLDWTRDRFDGLVPPTQQTWFALAAYNVGQGHVRDARQLARDQGLDPNRWFDNVEQAMLLKEQPEFYRQTRFGYARGREPVNYVLAVRRRYEAYLTLPVQ